VSDQYPGPPPPPPAAPGPWQPSPPGYGQQPGYGYPPGYGQPPGYPAAPGPPRRSRHTWVFAVLGGGLVVLVLGVAAAIAAGDDGSETSTGTTTTTVAAAPPTTPAPEAVAPPGPVTHSGNTENPPEADVTIASCGPDEFGVGWMADLVIVNNSSEPSSYFVTVSGLDAAGVVVGQGFGSASGIQPGQTAQVQALGLGDGVTSCTLATVDRYAT
jgi:hypothetical protein